MIDEQTSERIQGWAEQGRAFSLFRCPSEVSEQICDILIKNIPNLKVIRAVAPSELPKSPCAGLLCDIDAKEARKNSETLHNWLVRAIKWGEKPVFLFSPDPIDQWKVSLNLWEGDGKIDWRGLYFEQLFRLLTEASLCFPDPQELRHSDEKSSMTYIEKKLADVMNDRKLDYQPQAKIGRYHVDFLVRKNSTSIVVECDGAAYHSSREAKDRDARRDRDLNEQDFQVLRFTGGRIVSDANSCVNLIERALEELKVGLTEKVKLDDLDESQRGAVELPFKAARVLAPAGSGKTRVLINRGVHLANEGFPENRVLALAFNKKAKEEMGKRLKAKGLTKIEVRTFHGFGLSLLQRDVGIRFSGDPEWVEWSDAYYKKLQWLIQSVGVDPPKGPKAPERMRAAIQHIKNELKTPGQCLAELCNNKVRLRNVLNELMPKWSKAFEEFLEWQIEGEFLTFTDMIYLAVRRLAEYNELRRKYQGKYDAILVDEFQDLNAAQHALITILACPHEHLFVVGDDDQMIYGWLGARPKSITKFPETYPGSAGITLSVNYRCASKIVHHTNWLITHNKYREAKDIKPAPNAPDGLVESIVENGIGAEAEAVVKRLQQAHRDGFAWQELAILSRYKDAFAAMTEALRAANFPFYCKNQPNVYSSRPVSALTGYLYAVLDWPNPPHRVWSDILNVPNRYLPKKFMDEVEQELGQTEDNIIQFLRDARGFKGDQSNRIKTLLDDLQELHEWCKATRPSASELLEKIDSRFGISPYFENVPEASQQTTNDSDKGILIKILKELSSKYENPHEFLKYCEEQGRLEVDQKENTHKDGDVVQVMTIHRAKGKEWRGVALFHLEDKCHPDNAGFSHYEEQQRIEEERRVVYVGATRAKERLWVTAQRGAESQFFKELFLAPEYIDNSEKLEIDIQQHRNELATWEHECGELEEELAALKPLTLEHLSSEGITLDCDDENELRTLQARFTGRISGLKRNQGLLNRLLWWLGIKPERARRLEATLRFLALSLRYIKAKKELRRVKKEFDQLEEQQRIKSSMEDRQ